MTHIDFAFIDVKHMDVSAHLLNTGVSNDLILGNVRRLAASPRWRGRLVLRVPVIGGYNDGAENMEALLHFMRQCDLVELNLLPFHRLGASKWEQCGDSYAYQTQGDVAEEALAKLQDFFIRHQIACYIGDDTLF